MEYTIQIDAELANDPVLKSDINRAVEAALQAARQRFYSQKTPFYGRGLDPAAVKHTADLKERQDAEFQKNFGRARS